MTTSSGIPSREPDGDMPFDRLSGDEVDFIEEAVARISDADVDEHLAKILTKAGYDAPDTRLESAQKIVEAAREKAARIVADAREEADLALHQAARMVRDAREQAEQIIGEARNDAAWIAEFSSQITQSIPRPKTSLAVGSEEAAEITNKSYVMPSGQSAQGWPRSAIDIADLPPTRRPGRFTVTLGGSFAGRTWEFKLDVGRDKARYTDGLELSPYALEAPPHFPTDGPNRLDYEPVFERVQYEQVTPAIGHPLSREGGVRTTDRQLAAPSVNDIKATSNFWNSLNADQRRAFTARAHKRVFATGARLMHEGEEGDHVAVILSGMTEIRVLENGLERMVAVRGPGQLIGERAALEMSIRSASVVAIQTVVALIMRTADFAAFISTYPMVPKIVEEQIFARMREGSARYESDQHPSSVEEAAGDVSGQVSHRDVPRTPLLTGQNCTIVRTDVVAFGADERDDQARLIIRRATSEMTRLAFGPAWDICRWEDRGDGMLLVVSPDIPTAHVIDRLVTVLPQELKRHNRLHEAPARIQLRVAVEVGPVEEDDIGMSGYSIIQVSRMLDAPAFKQAVIDGDAVFGLIVSPFVYETYVRIGGRILDRADYAQVPVQVKETRRSAWMHLAGAAVPVLEQLIAQRRLGADTPSLPFTARAAWCGL